MHAARTALAKAKLAERRKVEEDYEAVLADVEAQVQTEVAREFDAVHNVARALEVGSLDALATARELRPTLCARLERSLKGEPEPVKVAAAPDAAVERLAARHVPAMAGNGRGAAARYDDRATHDLGPPASALSGASASATRIALGDHLSGRRCRAPRDG